MEKILILSNSKKLDNYNGYDLEFIVFSDLDDNFYIHSESLHICYPSTILSEIDKKSIKVGDCIKLNFYSPDGFENFKHGLFNQLNFKHSLYTQLSKREYFIKKMNINDYDNIINSFKMMSNTTNHKRTSFNTIPSLNKRNSIVERLKVLNRNRKIDEIIN